MDFRDRQLNPCSAEIIPCYPKVIIATESVIFTYNLEKVANRAGPN